MSEENKTQNEWEERELGALWRVNSSKGDFYSGHFKIGEKRYSIVCFPNKHKKPDSNQPDIRIYEGRDK